MKCRRCYGETTLSGKCLDQLCGNGPMNKTLAAKRDELAISETRKMIPGTVNAQSIYADGFDAGVAVCAQKIEKLERLLQIMLDPDNAPPQYSLEEAWKLFCELRKS